MGLLVLHPGGKVLRSSEYLESETTTTHTSSGVEDPESVPETHDDLEDPTRTGDSRDTSPFYALDHLQ